MLKGTMMEWLPYAHPDKLVGFRTQHGDNLTCREYYICEQFRFLKNGRLAELRNYDGRISLWVDRVA